MRTRILAATAALTLAITGLSAGAANAAPKTPTTSVTWTGQGTTATESTRSLITSVCDKTNGAPVDGNYIQFVLASTKTIDTATIKFGTDNAVAMTKSNTDKKGTSSYKYIYTGDKSLADLLALPVVAAYAGTGTPTFTVGQGCLTTFGGYTQLFSNNESVEDFAYMVSSDESSYTAALAIANAADTDKDGKITTWGVDVYNTFGYPIVPAFDVMLQNFDFTKMSGLTFKKADGTTVTTGIGYMVVLGLYALTDDGIDPTTFNTADDATPGSDYWTFSYNGASYRYDLVYGG